jgi:hypothetical protein
MPVDKCMTAMKKRVGLLCFVDLTNKLYSIKAKVFNANPQETIFNQRRGLSIDFVV